MIDMTLIPKIEKVIGWTFKDYQIKYLLGDKTVEITGTGTKIKLSQLKLALDYKKTITMIDLNSGKFNKNICKNTNQYVKSFLELRQKLSDAKLKVCKIK